jgi:signal transduction histidine kinase
MRASNDRVVSLGILQQRAAAYRELQADALQLKQLLGLRDGAYAVGGPLTTSSDQWWGGVSGVQIPIEQLQTIDATIQSAMGTSTLQKLGVSVDSAGLGFTPPDADRGALEQIGTDAVRLSAVMKQIAQTDQSLYVAGGPTLGMHLQRTQVEPLADDIARLTAGLATTTQASTDALIALDRDAFAVSQALFIAVAVASVVLALLLGYVLSLSLVRPIRRMGMRLEAIASGDFSGHVEVSNRDELGALAANLNRMNDELGRLYGELEAASRHKSEFLANMSHELRTPLNAIIGFSQVLKQRMYGDLNDRQAEYVDDVLTSGQHLLDLINDILDLAKVEAGRMELQPSIFSLPTALGTATAMVRERAVNHGLTLATEIDASVGLIEGDERKVKQIVFNLLSNAVKFTPEGGSVTLAARTVDDHVEISVRDTGIGISPEDQAKIFDEFYQVGGGRQQEGTGLGLALTRGLVELHHGRLTVESAPGAGSTFTVVLPLNQATAAEAADEAGKAATA